MENQVKKTEFENLEHFTKNSKKIQDLDFDAFFELDDSIRFIGVCTTDGRLLDAQYRNGIKPLLTDSGLQMSVMRTAIRNTTRKGEEGLMGKPIYSITAYENVKRVTIPVSEELLFLASFDKTVNENEIVPKILSILFVD